MTPLKSLPVGRNWEYGLDGDIGTPGVTVLLRNVGSVDPAHDGWILCPPGGSIHVAPEVALLLLRGLRAQR